MTVAEGVYRVPARAANTYLVEANEGLVLVDTGLPGSDKGILKSLDRMGRKPSEVKLVLLTHRHLDHIGGAAAVKKATSATLASHPFEKPYVAGTLMISTPPAWSGYGRIIRRVLNFTSWTMKLFRIVKYQSTHVDEAADEESLLEEMGVEGSVVWTPGHTKGSISLFLSKTRVAIIGDLLRSRRGRLVRPLFMESVSQTDASVQRVLDLGPLILCPGHGRPLPVSAVRLERLKGQMTTRVREEKREKEEDLEELTSGLV